MITGKCKVTIPAVARRVNHTGNLSLTIKQLGEVFLNGSWDFVNADLNWENVTGVTYVTTSNDFGFVTRVVTYKPTCNGLCFYGTFTSRALVTVGAPYRFDWGAFEVTAIDC